ncbi:hypothetical protein EJ08DRAFT_647097 [Tothia fuscella]|uniref:Uncharacterized protein n=1 Tax=Tothia fuscella TaxID=1048955 RepID=A0A9P4U1S5_9PEZI|nr:hypothetical protein EJ08DRAFT_647097 [Tothia fuscella]
MSPPPNKEAKASTPTATTNHNTDVPSTHDGTSASPFMGLPQEIRDMIYKEALIHETGVIKATKPICLLRVSKQDSYESKKVLLTLVKDTPVKIAFAGTKRHTHQQIFFDICPHLIIMTDLNAAFDFFTKRDDLKTLNIRLYRPPSFRRVEYLNSKLYKPAADLFEKLRIVRVSEASHVSFQMQPLEECDMSQGEAMYDLLSVGYVDLGQYFQEAMRSARFAEGSWPQSIGESVEEFSVGFLMVLSDEDLM